VQVLYVLISTFASYKLWNVLTHPDSKIWQKIPTLRAGRFQFLPSIRFFIRGKTLHFHHWLSLSALFCLSIFITSAILDSWVTRSFMVGGIVQGLSIPSARKIIYI